MITFNQLMPLASLWVLDKTTGDIKEYKIRKFDFESIKDSMSIFLVGLETSVIVSGYEREMPYMNSVNWIVATSKEVLCEKAVKFFIHRIEDADSCIQIAEIKLEHARKNKEHLERLLNKVKSTEI